MILGPDDPRAITGAERDAALANTERWNDILGIPRMSKAQQKQYDRDLNAILDLIGWEDEDES